MFQMNETSSEIKDVYNTYRPILFLQVFARLLYTLGGQVNSDKSAKSPNWPCPYIFILSLDLFIQHSWFEFQRRDSYALNFFTTEFKGISLMHNALA